MKRNHNEEKPQMKKNHKRRKPQMKKENETYIENFKENYT